MAFSSSGASWHHYKKEQRLRNRLLDLDRRIHLFNKYFELLNIKYSWINYDLYYKEFKINWPRRKDYTKRNTFLYSYPDSIEDVKIVCGIISSKCKKTNDEINSTWELTKNNLHMD